MTDEPSLRLAEGQRLLDGGELDAAVQLLAPLAGHPDNELATRALLAIGTAKYRNDEEDQALAAWQRAAELGAASSWLGWKSAAEQHVRNGDLEEAIGAYREADRRAPPHERGAIANRIAWLLKETGHDFAARRQFNRARGAYATYAAYVTLGLIGINVLVFLADGALSLGEGFSLFGSGGPLVEAGAVWQPAVAAGEWWRLVTSAFLHLGLLHLAFNMYVLWLFGPILEQLYGHLEYLVLYLLCALGGSVLTILAAPDVPAAGASGAIFGLLGLGFMVSRRRHLVLGPQARAILSRVGTLLVLNLVITFTIPRISVTGHLGGMLVGVAIGLLLAPGNVPSMGGLWRAPDGQSMAATTPAYVRALAYVLVAAVLALGTFIAIGQVG
jgi:membrane associated rhomboid family serine protease